MEPAQGIDKPQEKFGVGVVPLDMVEFMGKNKLHFLFGIIPFRKVGYPVGTVHADGQGRADHGTEAKSQRAGQISDFQITLYPDPDSENF